MSSWIGFGDSCPYFDATDLQLPVMDVVGSRLVLDPTSKLPVCNPLRCREEKSDRPGTPSAMAAMIEQEHLQVLTGQRIYIIGSPLPASFHLEYHQIRSYRVIECDRRASDLVCPYTAGTSCRIPQSSESVVAPVPASTGPMISL